MFQGGQQLESGEEENEASPNSHFGICGRRLMSAGFLLTRN